MEDNMTKPRIWTENDIEYLRRHYADADREMLEKYFDCSWRKIRNAAFRYGVSRGNPRRSFQASNVKVGGLPADVLTLRKTVTRLERRLRGIETEHQILARYLDELGPIPTPEVIYVPPTEPKVHEKEEVATLLFGDTQFGLIVLREVVGGLSRYSVEIFVERLTKLRDSIIEIVNIQRKSVPLHDLYIAGLGDWIEGENIYIGQPHHLEIDALRQIIMLGDLVPKILFAPLCMFFRNIFLRGVGGNHGKASRASPSNWDILVMHLWELRMAQYKNFHFHYEQDKLWTMYKVKPDDPDWADKTFFVTHGNQIRAWQGNFPSYGVARAFARYVGMLNTPINYLFVGHHHQPDIKPEMWGATIFNGSMVGGSEYSHNRLMMVGPSLQVMFCMNKDHITRADPLYLEIPPSLYFDDEGIMTYEGAEEDTWIGKGA